MQGTPTNEWLSRLQGNGPNLVSLVLAALIAVELARIAISFLSGPVKSPQPLIASTAQTRQHPAVDIQSVVSAHLFGIAKADPSTQDPANAPLSSANLVLAGTIATEDPKHGVAIISDGGPSKVYSVGQNVNGATLHSVYLDHVILDRGGTLETLLLPRQLAGDRNRPPSPVRRIGADPRTVAAVDNIRRMVQQDPGLLDQVMRTVPSYDNAAGKLRGFRAYPGRNRAIFNKLGLKPGDLVTAINGQALDDPPAQPRGIQYDSDIGSRHGHPRARWPKAGYHFEHSPSCERGHQGSGRGDRWRRGIRIQRHPAARRSWRRPAALQGKHLRESKRMTHTPVEWPHLHRVRATGTP
jgi:general secretion pathway protein C